MNRFPITLSQESEIMLNLIKNLIDEVNEYDEETIPSGLLSFITFIRQAIFDGYGSVIASSIRSPQDDKMSPNAILFVETIWLNEYLTKHGNMWSGFQWDTNLPVTSYSF
jgi:hypothetical protein